MSAKSQLIQQIEELVTPMLQDEQMELVDTQFVHEQGRWVLRFFLDKAGGVTLDDCARISDRLGPMLDAANLISQAYSLEVSSPGVYRPLKKQADFERFVGERVDVTVFAPIDGRRHFRGTLEKVNQGMVFIKDYTDQLCSVALEGIAKARLDPDVKF